MISRAYCGGNAGLSDSALSVLDHWAVKCFVFCRLADPAWFNAVFGSRATRRAVLRTLALATRLAAITQKLRQERKGFIYFVVDVGSVVVDDAGELKLDPWICGGIFAKCFQDKGVLITAHFFPNVAQICVVPVPYSRSGMIAIACTETLHAKLLGLLGTKDCGCVSR
ncbi:hypothetical protein KXD40_008970 [Peronospora effusa]|nr:hypothetical protein KXD40_008970 [Peronospora effusa]